MASSPAPQRKRTPFCDSLFSGIADEALRDELVASVQSVRLERNRAIYSEGQPGAYYYVVQEGFVCLSHTLVDGNHFIHQILSNGSSFGELAAFLQASHLESAVAMTDVVLCRIPRDKIEHAARQCTGFSNALARVIAMRVSSYKSAMHRLTSANLDARLASVLLQLGKTTGRQEQVGGKVRHLIQAPLTQSDLSAMVRSTRSNVNRQLKEFERMGMICMAGRTLAILDPERLQELSPMSPRQRRSGLRRRGRS